MRNKYLLLLIPLLFIIFFYFITRDDIKIKNYPPINKNIVAFGDSLVEGVGSTRGNDFVSLLSQKIGQPIINLGKSGNTTLDGLKRADEVLRQNPGIVILLLGGNDYIKKIPETETFNNLRELISKFQSNGSMVVLLGIRGGILNDNFEESFEKLADEMNVLYVPNVLKGLITNSKYMSDIIHPNDLGYEIIAEKVYEKLRGYITP